MSRIIAIDYGTKRTGLATTDPLRLIAGALDTVSTTDVLLYLEQYCAREAVDTFVVGQPRRMNNQPSEMMRHITPFVERLKKQFPDKKVVMADERFTSVLAHRAMLEGGLKKKARQDKALVDKISAVIILQTYLENYKLRITNYGLTPDFIRNS